MFITIFVGRVIGSGAKGSRSLLQDGIISIVNAAIIQIHICLFLLAILFQIYFLVQRYEHSQSNDLETFMIGNGRFYGERFGVFNYYIYLCGI